MHLGKIFGLEFPCRKLCFLFSILLLSASCSDLYDDKLSRDIYSLIDERRPQELIARFNKVDERYKIMILKGMGSFQDSLSLSFLHKVLQSGETDEQKTISAYAIGQYREKKNLPALFKSYASETDVSIKKAIIKAIGKSGGEDWLAREFSNTDADFYLSFSEAFFYSSLINPPSPGTLKTLYDLIETDNQQTLYYFFSCLSRFKGKLPPFNKNNFAENFSSFDVSVQAAYATCLTKMGRYAYPEILKISSSNEHYLVMIALVKGLFNYPSDSCRPVIQKTLIHEISHVREVSALWCFKNYKTFSDGYLLDIAKKEKNLKIKYLLFESILMNAPGERCDSLSKQIINDYQKEMDDYVKGFQLKALSRYFNNLSFIEEQTFSTPSILVREFGMESILRIRSDERFANYMTIWAKRNPDALPLDVYFSRMIKEAVQTWDVALVSICAVFLRDTSLRYKSSSNFPVVFESIDFMRDAIKRMNLPRDIEPYTEMLKTLCFYENKPVNGNLKPAFNNPIDWGFVQRIPVNQKVRITTSEGLIDLELYKEMAPATVAQFVKLITRNFYDNNKIHRVVPGFVMQDGCPRGDGYGSVMESIRTELHEELEFDEGTIGMANAGDDTESCQWFITYSKTPHLNGRYTAFGRVVNGMDVVHKLSVGSNIQSIRLLN